MPMILAGFLALFLIYQLAEASGQGLLKLPAMPYSMFLLFVLVIPAAHLVARWQGEAGLASYGMGLRAGWWQNYLLGLGLGLVVQGAMQWIGSRIGTRKLSNFRFSWRGLVLGLLWVLLTNFPAAAGEDLITRGYPWRFLQASPLAVFVLFSALLYTFNHIVRLLTQPVTNWYHLPFLGLTLAYALYQTGSLWLAIGLHQAGNVVYYLMQQMMDVRNTEDTRKRILFGILSELVMLAAVLAATSLAIKAIP